jgi:transcription termination/antitermination protein NusG
MEGSWFALQVKPRHEVKVSTILERKDYIHFLPTCREYRKWSDRAKVLEQPLFPGYVFCRGEKPLLPLARETPGIIRLVTFQGKPQPVPDEEILALQRAIQSRRELERCPYINIGVRACVISGPLVGITGIVISVKKRERLVISVDLIANSMSIEIDRSEVALLEGTHTPWGRDFKCN